MADFPTDRMLGSTKMARAFEVGSPLDDLRLVADGLGDSGWAADNPGGRTRVYWPLPDPAARRKSHPRASLFPADVTYSMPLVAHCWAPSISGSETAGLMLSRTALAAGMPLIVRSADVGPAPRPLPPEADILKLRSLLELAALMDEHAVLLSLDCASAAVVSTARDIQRAFFDLDADFVISAEVQQALARPPRAPLALGNCLCWSGTAALSARGPPRFATRRQSSAPTAPLPILRAPSVSTPAPAASSPPEPWWPGMPERGSRWGPRWRPEGSMDTLGALGSCTSGQQPTLSLPPLL